MNANPGPGAAASGDQPSVSFLLDAGGRIAAWSLGAAQAFGYSGEEVVGQPLAFLHPEGIEYQELADQDFVAARHHGDAWNESWWIRKDRTRFLRGGILTALRNAQGEAMGFVQRLVDAGEGGEPAISAALRQAEAASRAKDEFLARVAHQLRTPLSAVMLWTNLLERMQAPSRQEFVDALDVIRMSVREQRALLDDLGDLTQIAGGCFAIETSPGNVAAVARQELDDAIRRFTDLGLTFEGQFEGQPTIVEIDARQLGRAIAKLLANAVRFSDEGGRIRMEVASDPMSVCIRVVDGGHGFDSARQAEISAGAFSAAEGSGHLGIGLRIAREIARLHGGTLTGESEGPGRGATFTLRLPLRVP